MMAHSGPLLEDMDEVFCQCPICLQPYREPKQLPCTHRYCYECLKHLLDRDRNNANVRCPECRKEFPVPVEGVGGFQTDFHTAKLVEYIKSKKLFQDETLQVCCVCSKDIVVTAYCIKCHGFLCQECQNYHLTTKRFSDHSEHTFSLENLKSMNITEEQHVGVKEAPRCKIHPENLIRLCCKTCDNLPVCRTCTMLSHSDHKLDNISEMATAKGGELNKELETLQRYKERIKAASQSAENFQRDLSFDFSQARDQFQVRHEMEVDSIDTDMKHLTDKFDRDLTETEERKNKNLKQRRGEMEKEIKEIRRRYSNIFSRIEKEAEKKVKDLTENYQQQINRKENKLELLDRDRSSFYAKIQNKEEVELNHSQEIIDQIDGTVEESEKWIVTARRVVETKNDWMAVQRISEIRSAMKSLYVQIERDLLDAETLSKRSSHFCVELVKDQPSPVHIEGISAKKWEVNAIAKSGGDKIVITGPTSKPFESHITVIDTEGNIILQKLIEGHGDWSYQFCASMFSYNIATVCRPNKIGTYDAKTGSWIRKSKVINNKNDWSSHLFVTCVAIDFAKCHILVGSNSSDIFVYDYQLNFRYTFKLPGIVKYPYAMTVSGNSLLVCDNTGKQAYVIAMGGWKGMPSGIHEFAIPNLNGADFKPTSVCSDRNGFVYILWKGRVAGESKCFLVRYRQDGLQILTVTFVDNDAECIAIFQTENREKILIATRKSGKIHVFNLWSI